MDLLLTGAGSLGLGLVRELINNKDEFDCIRILDNSEQSLHLADALLQDIEYRLILGDLKDERLVRRLVKKSDIVIHTAARKFVDLGEYNPKEFIDTNVLGTWNVALACTQSDVSRALFISSDKSVYPINLYGLTKSIGEHIWLWANSISRTRMSIIRSVNFWNSAGSVFETWDRQAAEGVQLTVTHDQAVRFFIDIDTISKFILERMRDMDGGEIFIPEYETHSIMELAKRHSKGNGIRLIGMNRAEKLCEDLYTDFEKRFITKHNSGMVIKK